MKRAKTLYLGISIFLISTVLVYFFSPSIFGWENNFFVECTFSTTTDGGSADCRPNIFTAIISGFILGAAFIYWQIRSSKKEKV